MPDVFLLLFGATLGLGIPPSSALGGHSWHYSGDPLGCQDQMGGREGPYVRQTPSLLLLCYHSGPCQTILNARRMVTNVSVTSLLNSQPQQTLSWSTGGSPGLCLTLLPTSLASLPQGLCIPTKSFFSILLPQKYLTPSFSQALPLPPEAGVLHPVGQGAGQCK